MSTRNSRVFLGFGLAVAAAIAAVAWLLFSGTPAAPPTSGGSRIVTPPRPVDVPADGAPLPPPPPPPPPGAGGGGAPAGPPPPPPGQPRGGHR